MWKKILHKIKDFRQPKAVILMYHHVCEKKSDPWDLAVHPERFAAQLYALKNNFNVVSVEELAETVEKKRLTKNLVAITFDDGFVDNYTHAAPMLEWLRLPATFYVSTDTVGNRKPYWWDELQTIVFHTEQLPRSLSLYVNGQPVGFEFTTDYTLRGKLTQEIKTWRVTMPVPNERVRLYIELWQKLQPLRHDQQDFALREIKSWSNSKRLEGAAHVMQVDEIQRLSRSPLFTVGAHTVHHAMLASQSLSDQAFEVAESKRIIENWIGKKITGFAYPYGNYSAETKSLLWDAGFKYAVSTEWRGVKNSDNTFELPRIQVKNWNVHDFVLNIRKALS